MSLGQRDSLAGCALRLAHVMFDMLCSAFASANEQDGIKLSSRCVPRNHETLQ